MANGKRGGDENLYLGADSEVFIYSNVQNGISQAMPFEFNTSGDFIAPRYIYCEGNKRLTPNTWRGYQTKQYTYQYTIPANGEARITGTDLGVSTPSGYTPVAVVFYNTDNTNVYPIWLSAEATGSSWVAILRSIVNSQLIQTFTVKILYLQTGNP